MPRTESCRRRPPRRGPGGCGGARLRAARAIRLLRPTAACPVAEFLRDSRSDAAGCGSRSRRGQAIEDIECPRSRFSTAAAAHPRRCAAALSAHQSAHRPDGARMPLVGNQISIKIGVEGRALLGPVGIARHLRRAGALRRQARRQGHGRIAPAADVGHHSRRVRPRRPLHRGRGQYPRAVKTAERDDHRRRLRRRAGRPRRRAERRS